MISITYASSAKALFSFEELTKLLIKSRAYNHKVGVTGLLLYKEGNFMQTIEGTEENVRDVYNRIALDNRHHNIMNILDHKIEERNFASWEMAFRNLNEHSLQQLPGYSEFLNMPLSDPSFKTNPTSAQKLMLMFRRSMR